MERTLALSHLLKAHLPICSHLLRKVAVLLPGHSGVFRRLRGPELPLPPPPAWSRCDIVNKPPSPSVTPRHGTAPARKRSRAPAAAPPGMEFRLPPPLCGAARAHLGHTSGTAPDPRGAAAAGAEAPPAGRGPARPYLNSSASRGPAKATNDQKKATTTKTRTKPKQSHSSSPQRQERPGTRSGGRRAQLPREAGARLRSAAPLP
ncbi:atherin-like [Prinia subflava]|uniref:atherin-like n=1 Tax=Prinia subflava TaxID=208062 RepID=UPI002FE0EEE7